MVCAGRRRRTAAGHAGADGTGRRYGPRVRVPDDARFSDDERGQSVAITDWIAKNRMNWIHPCENAHGEPKLWYERREKIVPEIQKRGLHLIFGGHTMHTWLPEEYFKEHPRGSRTTTVSGSRRRSA